MPLSRGGSARERDGMETRRSWSGYVGVALIPAGIAIVILNYAGLMPGGTPTPGCTWGCLRFW